MSTPKTRSKVDVEQIGQVPAGATILDMVVFGGGSVICTDLGTFFWRDGQMQKMAIDVENHAKPVLVKVDRLVVSDGSDVPCNAPRRVVPVTTGTAPE